MSKILIVDDDPGNREIIKLRLEHAGYLTEQAANGEEGLNSAQQNAPDLVILDVMMPKIDGWQVCRKLKSDDKTKDIPIIMLTARNQQIEELRGWESGADEYLTKPCDYKMLIEKIENFLSRKTSGQP